MKKPEALICDSDRQAILLCERALIQSGYEVQIAGCGMTAIACIRAQRPDVVIVGENLQWGGIETVLESIEDLETDAEDGKYSPHVLAMGARSAHQLSLEFGLPLKQCLEKPLARWNVMNAVSWAVTRPAGELARV